MTGKCPRCGGDLADFWDMANKRCKNCGLTKRELLTSGPGPIRAQAARQANVPKWSLITQGYFDVTGQGLMGAYDESI
jgi:hypothetical protein